MELVTNCDSYEDARNEALAWMESLGGPIGVHHEIEIGRLALAVGHDVSVASSIDPYRRMRLDYDPMKGLHVSAEVDKGVGRMKHAFTFPGDASTIVAHLRSRDSR